MTTIPVNLNELLETRARLIADIRPRLYEGTKRFLLTLHDGEPDFTAIDLPQAACLPAIRWKLTDLNKRIEQNTEKHAAQPKEVEALF